MKKQTNENVVQEAIDKTGFGKFNLKVTVLGAFIYSNAVISIISVGFILPAAVCDFQMSTIDKGRIVIAPVLGSLFGPIIWGFLADLKGRRIALMITLFIQANSEILMSLVSNYWGFLLFKLFSGFAVIGQTTLSFTYVGEFQPKINQKRILSCVSLIMVCGLILVPILAWILIPLKFEYRNEYFLFRSWNLFVLICALPANVLAIWLIFSPETPKFLAESGQNFKLMTVLIDMYVENVGGSGEEYIEKLALCESDAIKNLVNNYVMKSTYTSEEKTINRKELRSMIEDFKKQGKSVSEAPYLKYLIILSVSMFCVSSSFYSLLLWFPEIFQRFSQFEALYPNETASICTISRYLLPSNSTQDITKVSFKCNQEVDTSVYFNSLIQGFSALIPYILLPLLVDKLGFRFISVSLLGIALLSTIGLLFANSYLQNVILSCLFNATMSVCSSVMYSFPVVLFPTNFRVFATTISVLCSRLGTIVGNVTVTYLIDNYCIILVTSVIAQILLAAVMNLALQN